MVKTPLEDFTTEILAGILYSNLEIRNSFANEILKIEGDDFEISTQERFILNEIDCPDCRVDLVVRSQNMICFVENKVESREGYIQLARYGKALDNHVEDNKTYLRYCTKYHDYKEVTYHDFLQFRWTDIYKFLKKWQFLTDIQHYLQFLNEHDMSDNMNFDFNDLIALQEMNPVIKKMDSYLDKIKPLFNKNITFKLKDSSLLRQIKDHSRYIHHVDMPFGANGYCELGLGFKFEDVPSLTIWIWCSDSNIKSVEFKAAINQLTEDEFDNNKENWISLNKPISDFLSVESMDKAIEDWFITSFQTFKKFISNTPQLKWNIH